MGIWVWIFKPIRFGLKVSFFPLARRAIILVHIYSIWASIKIVILWIMVPFMKLWYVSKNVICVFNNYSHDKESISSFSSGVLYISTQF